MFRVLPYEDERKRESRGERKFEERKEKTGKTDRQVNRQTAGERVARKREKERVREMTHGLHPQDSQGREKEKEKESRQEERGRERKREKERERERKYRERESPLRRMSPAPGGGRPGGLTGGRTPWN